ncbi:uncharacterized protein LOC9634875 [Selaginella moellendorffii]|uniref:uncharacterized protein LOC9634875 n=1 Tax=Selaginella moellendorffii TaxID=88036 RepID=UPI000D1CA1EA|nr:uncharacterized protein LOC9634875 [Selaginella moellendorffii]|eukprot:XP_024543040.1 uncharacterized protein LOC9634875 [Selaginella moellendorffii]
MMLTPCFLEEEYALSIPSSFDSSPFGRTLKSRHERSKSAPSNERSFDGSEDGSFWDVYTPTDHRNWRCLDWRTKHRLALERDVCLLQIRLQEEQATRASLEKALVNASSCLSPDCKTIATKARDLIAETALIEHEVAHLEKRVLWLYRKILIENVPNKATDHLPENPDTPSKVIKFVVRKKQQDDHHHHSRKSPLSQDPIFKSSFRDRLSSSLLSSTSPVSSKASPLHHLLGAIQPRARKKLSEMPETPPSLTLERFSSGFVGSPSELSAALVRGMAGIFGKLADVPQSSPSPLFSSWSSSSSPRNLGGLLSNPFQLSKQLGDCGAYRFVVEVPWISIDKQQLGYVAQPLQEFKTMVKQLSKVDVASMDCNEKLAFWINIYNALVMHAHLAYGIPTSKSKRESLLHKAAYKVGSVSVTAYTIAQFVLAWRSDSQNSREWLQALISPLARPKPRIKRTFTYSLPHPEPLVCFALCSGARSDPSLRVYTAIHVRAQLQIAKLEFLQASVGVGAKNTLLLPRILHDFLSEIGVSSRGLLQWLCHNLPEQHSLSLKACVKHLAFEWLPYNSSFRYMFVRDLLDFG